MLKTSKSLNQIRRQHRLKLILMFGSSALGQTHQHSDLDIAVLPENPKQPINQVVLIQNLSQTLNSNHIDLVNLSQANPLLLKQITDQNKLLSGSQKNLDLLQLKAFHQYNDYLPYFKLEQKTVRENINAYA